MFHSHLRPRHNEALSSPDAVSERQSAGESHCQPDRVKCDSPGFALKKFYLDAVTDAGDYFIGYAADLFFKRLSLGYADTVYSPELYGLRSGPKMGRGREPVWQNGALIWCHPGLGFEGRWSPLAPPRRVGLLSTPQGHVDWHCMQPAAKVSLETASGLVIEALGYCDHLTLTILPWQLGLTELIWGRFVSVSQSVVWIVWRGKHAMRLVLWNDNSTDCADISDGHVVTDDFALAIEPARTLRQGSLSQNVLSKVPAAYRLAPAAFLQVRESKKLGRGILRMRDGHQHDGWVIHEKVTWPH